jgi:hypothetical protein
MYYNESAIEVIVKRISAAKYACALIALNDAAKFASEAAYLEPTNLKYHEFADKKKSLLAQPKEYA